MFQAEFVHRSEVVSSKGGRATSFSPEGARVKTAKNEAKMIASDKFNPFSWPRRKQHLDGLKPQRLRWFQRVF